MGFELAVPLLAMMGAVVPAFMSLGCLCMLVGLLIRNGSLEMAPNRAVAPGFVAAGFALFGHVRGAPRRT